MLPDRLDVVPSGTNISQAPRKLRLSPHVVSLVENCAILAHCCIKSVCHFYSVSDTVDLVTVGMVTVDMVTVGMVTVP